MRNLLIAICITVFINASGQRIKLGFRSGVDFANFYGHYLKGDIPTSSFQPGTNPPPSGSTQLNYYYKTDFIRDMRFGFFSYVFLDVTLKERLTIEYGLGYCQKGVNMNFNLNSSSINPDNSTTEQSYSFDRNLRLDYITIPVSFQYKLGKKKRFYILGGVYTAFAVNFIIKNSQVTLDEKSYSSSGQLMTESKTSIVDNKTYAKIFDSGIIGGFGVNFPLTEKLTIGLELRSAIGLTSVPGKYEEHGFQSFSQTAKNINFETGLKLLYILK